MSNQETNIEFYAGYLSYNSLCTQEKPNKILVTPYLYIQSYIREDNGELGRLGGAEESGNPYGFNERVARIKDSKGLYKGLSLHLGSDMERTIRAFCIEYYQDEPYITWLKKILKNESEAFKEFKEDCEKSESIDEATPEECWEEFYQKVMYFKDKKYWTEKKHFMDAEIVDSETETPDSIAALQDIINILNKEFFPALNSDNKLSISEKMKYIREMIPRLSEAMLWRGVLRRKTYEGFRKQLRDFIKAELTQLKISAQGSIVLVPRAFTDAEIKLREKTLLSVAGIPKDFRTPTEQILYNLTPDQQQIEIDKYWKTFLEQARECMDGDDITLFIAVLSLARKAQMTFEKNRKNISIHSSGTMMDTDRIDWFRADADVVLKEMGLDTEGRTGSDNRKRFREKAMRLSDFSQHMKITVKNTIIEKHFRLFSFSSSYKKEEENDRGRKRAEVWNFQSLKDLLFPLNIPQGSSYEKISLKPAQWLNKTRPRKEAAILSGDAFWIQVVAFDKLAVFKFDESRNDVSFTEPINKLALAKDKHKEVRENRLKVLSEALAQASPDIKIQWTAKDFSITLPRPTAIGREESALPKGLINIVRKEAQREVKKEIANSKTHRSQAKRSKKQNPKSASNSI